MSSEGSIDLKTFLNTKYSDKALIDFFDKIKHALISMVLLIQIIERISPNVLKRSRP